TMFAFKEAVAAGADMLEMDVQLSSDGELIVQHDDTIDKTTNETGAVSVRTLAELQTLDNAYWFSPQCWPCQDRPIEEYIYRGVRTGDVAPPEGYEAEDFRIITFREVAEAFPDIPLDIEIKGDFPAAVPVAEKLADEIADLDRTDSVIVVSFDSELVAAFAELAPDVATSPGLDEMVAWFLSGKKLGDYQVVQVPPDFEGIEVVNEAFMKTAADSGVDVWVWPSDAGAQENEAFYREMIDLGVAGVIAGRPAEMANAVS
ncbi:MAG: glycerophosphodiester phosphodiesterase, partial [Acidobacteria bacterium]|nr:glycerophosphodiester phosphodiesterase [Acidobacteriota bacterium]